MSKPMSLAEARIKLNMPFASEKEVRAAAQKRNIQIIDLNLGGIKNTANLGDLNNRVGGSLFGTSVMSGNSQSSLNSPIFGNSNIGNSNLSGLSNNSALSQPSLSTPSYVDNTSVFGNSSLSAPKTLDFNFNKFISSSVAKGNENFVKMNAVKSGLLEGQQLVDQSRVVSTEFGEAGQIIKTLDNGEKVTISIDPKKLPNGGKNGKKYSKIEYVDGQVIYYDLSGKKIDEKTRPARYGERGYVKSGNSIEEDLQAKVGGKYEKLVGVQNEIQDLKTKLSELAPDDPQREDIQNKINKLVKKEETLTEKVMADYVKQIIKECDGDEAKLKAKVEELRNNSDISSKASVQLCTLVSRVHEASKNGLSQEALTSFYENIIDDPNPEATSDRIDAMVPEVAKGRGRKASERARAFGSAAHRLGHGNTASSAMIRHTHEVVDAEVAAAMGSTAITISDDPSKASQDLSSAIQNPPNGSKISDEVKVGWSAGFDQAGVATGKVEVMQAGQDVITSIESADLQVQANAQSTAIYENASDDVKENHSRVVGSNLHKYHNDAQLRVDENERAHDTNDAYNTSASDILHLVCADNQTELVQRTLDSGNENAINNIASHAYDYDISNREDVIRMVKELGTEKTLEILDNARKEYEAQDADNKEATEALNVIQENQQQAQTKTTETKTTETKTTKKIISQPATTIVFAQPVMPNLGGSSDFIVAKFGSGFGLSSVQTFVNSSEFKSADIKTKEEYISKLSATDKKQAIGVLVENSQDYELQTLMLCSLKKDVLRYLVNHPNSKNKESLNYLKGFLSGVDIDYIKDLKEERQKARGEAAEIQTVAVNTKRNFFNIHS